MEKDEVKALERWRNGWGGQLWKKELVRLWNGEDSPLDSLYGDPALYQLRGRLESCLAEVSIGYNGPDRD